jgi:UDP-glucose 4-epimerase
MIHPMVDGSSGLRVAVTGPTGEIGKSFVRALDAAAEVGHIMGMARSPFDPRREGLKKVEYVQGDILNRASVDRLVDGADVVVHLAFMLFGDAAAARTTNLEGSRNVFETAVAAGARRLVYTSSVAAYGFHEDNPDLLTEDVSPRGSENHYYSQQKAEVETLLTNVARSGSTDVYIFRPCIVAGPDAPALVEHLPYVKLSERLPDKLIALTEKLPLLRPVIPDPGIPFQLVHHDDVASALLAAVTGKGEPGIYNLAGEGVITVTNLAHALGWYALPVPQIAVDATAKIVSAMPYLPSETRWINALKVPVLIDSTRARTKLSWEPAHDALETLAEMIAAARERGAIPWPGKP